MKLLVLTSSTGGGHDMRARSLKAWAEHPSAASLGIQVEVFQTLESLDGLYKFGVETYNWIQLHAPWLHHGYFNFLELAAMHRKASAIKGRERFAEELLRVRPDVIVSTHAHLNHGFFALAKEVLGADKVKCLTYCGELFGGYGFSKHWVNPASDGFIGAVQETCDWAAHLGMAADKNHVGGFMLNPGFWVDPLSPEAKRQWITDTLGLDPDQFILVLATGANSANNHLDLLDGLARAKVCPQVVALCGRNEVALDALNVWGIANPEIRIKPLPYFTEMFKLLQCASAVVARPGTGTTSESILAGCPIIFNGLGGIMPQEWITVKFMRAHGIDLVMNRAGQLPKLVKPLLDNPEQLADTKAKMVLVRPQQHPLDILKRLASLA
ncbi:glycosyltransferase [Cerasicoccus maritimus]|uniref:glycosyltransferase n=1 Tax=Cerasicoccus maritimus TaxID=490089 RepID=UPI0028525030|nr:glycosyltransferase [Cerasicoccus maritimus]